MSLTSLAKGRVRLPNQMNFRKSAWGGEGGQFQSKNLYCNMKLIQRVISGFRVGFFNNCIVLHLYYTYLWKSCACISYYLALIPPCIYAIWFSENEGGVKGHFELFRKFVRFGTLTRPLLLKRSHILIRTFACNLYTFAAVYILHWVHKIDAAISSCSSSFIAGK